MFLLIILLHCVQIFNKLIAINYTIESRPIIEASINNANKARLILNTILPYSMIETSDIGKGLIPMHTYNIKSVVNYKVNQYNSSLSMSSLKLFPFIFNAADKIMYYPDRGIALGYKFKDERYSIIHQLYMTKQINNKRFAFNALNKENGTFYIGDIPNNDFKYKGYCNVGNNSNHWGCNLTKIKYNNKEYTFNQNAVLHSSCYYIYSDTLFDFMIDYVFNDEIKNGICKVKK